MHNHKFSVPTIDAHDLCKSFNETKAVVNLSLKIYPGTIFGLLGANGSGKTTSLRMLSGLILPDQGTATCLGFNLFTQTKLLQSQIGYMPQQFCLYQNLSVYENLDFIARIYGLKSRKQRIKQIIELFLLSAVQDQLSHTLSGGWQKRLALAAAMLHNPQLLLLDEPTSGIDPFSRILMWEHIQEFASKGMTVVLSTHHMDEAERCQQLAYMAYGRILASGYAKEIIENTGLITWRITGKNLAALKAALKKTAVNLMLIEKGNEIRISAKDPDALQKIDLSLLNNYEVRETDTTLEDVFIFKICKQE